MRFQEYVSQEPFVRLGLIIGKTLPRWAGYGLARSISAAIAAFRPQVYHVVEQNLRQALGPQAESAALRETATRIFYHAGQSYYDFSRALEMPPAQYREVMHLPADFVQNVRNAASSGRGLVMIGPHLSNFNLLGLAVGSLGVPVQLLSRANPTENSRVWNRLLERGDLRVTPVSPEALRLAIRGLKQGGVVITGGDLPIRGEESTVEFFGRAACLPSGPVRIAMLTGAAVIVGGCRFDGSGRYALEASAPIELERTGDRRQDVLRNTQKLAGMLEALISRRPEQWLMFHPVWEETSV